MFFHILAPFPSLAAQQNFQLEQYISLNSIFSWAAKYSIQPKKDHFLICKALGEQEWACS
jgi:hypothetical protein